MREIMDVPVTSSTRDFTESVMFVLVPPMQEQIDERVSERIVAQKKVVQVPQTMEEVMEVMKLVPEKQIEACTAEEIIDALAPQLTEETSEVTKSIPQNRCNAASKNTTIDSAVPGDRCICFNTHVGSSGDQGTCNPVCPGHSSDKMVDAHVPQIQKQTVEVADKIAQQWVQNRTVEQAVGGTINSTDSGGTC